MDSSSIEEIQVATRDQLSKYFLNTVRESIRDAFEDDVGRDLSQIGSADPFYTSGKKTIRQLIDAEVRDTLIIAIRGTFRERFAKAVDYEIESLMSKTFMKTHAVGGNGVGGGVPASAPSSVSSKKPVLQPGFSQSKQKKVENKNGTLEDLSEDKEDPPSPPAHSRMPPLNPDGKKRASNDNTKDGSLAPSVSSTPNKSRSKSPAGLKIDTNVNSSSAAKSSLGLRSPINPKITIVANEKIETEIVTTPLNFNAKQQAWEELANGNNHHAPGSAKKTYELDVTEDLKSTIIATTKKDGEADAVEVQLQKQQLAHAVAEVLTPRARFALSKRISVDAKQFSQPTEGEIPTIPLNEKGEEISVSSHISSSDIRKPSDEAKQQHPTGSQSAEENSKTAPSISTNTAGSLIPAECQTPTSKTKNLREAGFRFEDSSKSAPASNSSQAAAAKTQNGTLLRKATLKTAQNTNRLQQLKVQYEQKDSSSSSGPSMGPSPSTASGGRPQPLNTGSGSGIPQECPSPTSKRAKEQAPRMLGQRSSSISLEHSTRPATNDGGKRMRIEPTSMSFSVMTNLDLGTISSNNSDRKNRSLSISATEFSAVKECQTPTSKTLSKGKFEFGTFPTQSSTHSSSTSKSAANLAAEAAASLVNHHATIEIEPMQ